MTTIQNGGNDGQGIHDLGGSARTPRAARPQGTPGKAPAAPPTSNPSLHVSASGERFVSLRARLEGLDPSRAERAERVEQLRQLVAAGRYEPDAEAVASAMLADPATAAALGMRGLGSSRSGAPSST
jgi:flagellar biosynthesis anti-sigma factor FlgM